MKSVRFGFLWGLLLFGLSTGWAQDYGESPTLAERVAAGTLPPVEERLPEEPLVLEPETIGTYGGTLTTAYKFLGSWPNEVNSLIGFGGLAKVDAEGNIVPDIAEGWELSPDARELTLRLRPGMKWSDSAPFTADDIVFWYEDVLLNEELTPVVPNWFRPGGETFALEKVDDHTVVMRFAAPNPTITARFVNPGASLYLPRHYLEAFHPRYADEAELDVMVEEGGFETVAQFFQNKLLSYNYTDSRGEVGAPTLLPYTISDRSTSLVTLARNPYYWKVDAEGNQLPYIDSIRARLVEDSEVVETQAINGELDWYPGVAGNLGLYTRNAAEEDYRVILWREGSGAQTGLFVNQTHADPDLREAFQDARFRQALSLAIDREEINNLIYLDQGLPIQSTVVPPSKFYKEEYAQAYAAYDPDEADRLLDEMGLERNSEGVRTLPGGTPLEMSIMALAGKDEWVDTAELVADYWTQIGIPTVLDTPGRELLFQRMSGNDFDVAVWSVDTPEVAFYSNLREFVPTDPTFSMQGPAWALWYQNGGAASEGEGALEPPDSVKELYSLYETWTTAGSQGERDAALEELLALQAENLWHIGTVARVTRPLIVDDELRNVPEGLTYNFFTGFGYLADPETWYFETIDE